MITFKILLYQINMDTSALLTWEQLENGKQIIQVILQELQDIWVLVKFNLTAPEVMCRQPHTYAVDYFALGVLCYEFMLGRVLIIVKTQETVFGKKQERNKRLDIGKKGLD